MKNPTNLVLLAAFAASILAGCGSNPSNCLSDSVIQATLENQNVPGECDPDPNHDPCGIAGQGGDITRETHTAMACMFKGSAGCGPVDDHGCSRLGQITWTINKIGCTDYGGNSSTVECLAGYILDEMNQGCNPPPGPARECKKEETPAGE